MPDFRRRPVSLPGPGLTALLVALIVVLLALMLSLASAAGNGNAVAKPRFGSDPAQARRPPPAPGSPLRAPRARRPPRIPEITTGAEKTGVGTATRSATARPFATDAPKPSS